MKYILLLVLICAVVIVYILTRRRKISDPVDTYVCTECDKMHCICHKEEKP
jgi:hypothetical protein